MTINNRIELIINALELNNNSFSMRIGVNSTVIHNIVKGRNAPSYDVLQKILLSFDNISADWLLTEKGEMIGDSSVKEYSRLSSDPKINVSEPPRPCPNCSALKHALKQTERALEHAESEIAARKETILLLTDKINDLTEKFEKSRQKG